MKRSTVIFIFLFVIIFQTMTILHGQNSSSGTTKSASHIIELIIKQTGSATIPNTVDIIKAGDPVTEVTGILTSMFATMDILNQAVEKNCNLIIVHEPVFYNHLDQTKQFQNDPVFLEKKRFIDDHKLVIWRFHDYIHRMKPDGILSGMVTKLGWEKYVVNGNLQQFQLPETTLTALLKELKVIFPETAFYVIGEPDFKIVNVRLAPGAPGSSSHIRLLEDQNVDVVLAGESPQWETYEYMRDAVYQGRKKAIIFLGHIASEEAGMDYCAGWIKTFIRDIPVYSATTGPSYWSY